MLFWIVFLLKSESPTALSESSSPLSLSPHRAFPETALMVSFCGGRNPPISSRIETGCPGKGFLPGFSSQSGRKCPDLYPSNRSDSSDLKDFRRPSSSRPNPCRFRSIPDRGMSVTLAGMVANVSISEDRVTWVP